MAQNEEMEDSEVQGGSKLVPQIRAIIVPRLNHKHSYIHVGKPYEGSMVSTIRDETINLPGQVIPMYSVYDEKGDIICTIQCCSVIVYYYSKHRMEGHYEPSKV